MTHNELAARIERAEGAGKWDDVAQDALNRMRRAHNRGTGCHLTAEMIANLSITVIGEIWSQEDPRARSAS